MKRRSISARAGSIAQELYSNFSTYFIDGQRQATTSLTVRSNITANRQIEVTTTCSISGFRFVRIPPDNWSTLSTTLRPTLSIVSGGSIDGGSSSKQFYKQVAVLKPDVSGERANALDQFDIFTMTPADDSVTVLTPGTYNIALFATDANRNIATLINSLFPIDTSGVIYPTTAATTHFVMEIF